MKAYRQSKILEIIAASEIETQNQLMNALSAADVKSTQATVSRDIKELRLVKELSQSGRHRYVAAGREGFQNSDQRLRKIFRESVSSWDTAQNIIVLKTLPGLAQAACAALDAMNVAGLIGTIGGDDTAFLAMCDNEAAERFCRDIENIL